MSSRLSFQFCFAMTVQTIFRIFNTASTFSRNRSVYPLPYSKCFTEFTGFPFSYLIKLYIRDILYQSWDREWPGTSQPVEQSSYSVKRLPKVWNEKRTYYYTKKYHIISCYIFQFYHSNNDKSELQYFLLIFQYGQYSNNERYNKKYVHYGTF